MYAVLAAPFTFPLQAVLPDTGRKAVGLHGGAVGANDGLTTGAPSMRRGRIPLGGGEADGAIGPVINFAFVIADATT